MSVQPYTVDICWGIGSCVSGSVRTVRSEPPLREPVILIRIGVHLLPIDVRS